MKINSPLPQRKTRLEIIPLIDVMFFLLAAFMMVSLTMSKQQTIKVNLPVAASAESDFKPDMINIAVNATGDLFLDTDAITLPDLQAKLEDRFALAKDTPVYISGDVDTRFEDLVRALDIARKAGFTKVAFNVKPVDAAGGSAVAPQAGESQ